MHFRPGFPGFRAGRNLASSPSGAIFARMGSKDGRGKPPARLDFEPEASGRFPVAERLGPEPAPATGPETPSAPEPAREPPPGRPGPPARDCPEPAVGAKAPPARAQAA